MTYEARTQKHKTWILRYKLSKSVVKLCKQLIEKLIKDCLTVLVKSLLHLGFNHPSILTLKILQKLYKQVLKDSKNLDPQRP